MKKHILLCLVLAISVSSFCQQSKTVGSYTKQDYLKKSKMQKTIAWVMVGSGTVMAAISVSSFTLGNAFGSAFGDENSGDNINRGEATFYIGSALALGSIPFFIVSSKNKRKAMSMSFRNQLVPVLQGNGFANRAIPSLILKINL